MARFGMAMVLTALCMVLCEAQFKNIPYGGIIDVLSNLENAANSLTASCLSCRTLWPPFYNKIKTLDVQQLIPAIREECGKVEFLASVSIQKTGLCDGIFGERGENVIEKVEKVMEHLHPENFCYLIAACAVPLNSGLEILAPFSNASRHWGKFIQFDNEFPMQPHQHEDQSETSSCLSCKVLWPSIYKNIQSVKAEDVFPQMTQYCKKVEFLTSMVMPEKSLCDDILDQHWATLFYHLKGILEPDAFCGFIKACHNTAGRPNVVWPFLGSEGKREGRSGRFLRYN